MLAVWAAKISEKASVHIFHRQGVTWAGKIALKIDPSILHDLAGQVRKDIFIVCGTNGKTTTNNMLCAAIEKEDNNLVNIVGNVVGEIETIERENKNGYLLA